MFITGLCLSLFGNPISFLLCILLTAICVACGHYIELYGVKYRRDNGVSCVDPDWFTSFILYGLILGPLFVIVLVTVIIDCIDSDVKTF